MQIPRLRAGGHLDEQRVVADEERPHANASTRTPAASSRSRTRRGQTDRAGRVAVQAQRPGAHPDPGAGVRDDRTGAREAHRAFDDGVRVVISTAPSRPRGTSVPSSVYAPVREGLRDGRQPRLRGQLQQPRTGQAQHRQRAVGQAYALDDRAALLRVVHHPVVERAVRLDVRHARAPAARANTSRAPIW
ncbi:hypothetical protein GCM10017687_85070 [Streptomyces echinatus]